MIETFHRFAGIVLRTRSDLALPHLLREPFRKFVVQGETPHVQCHIRRLQSSQDLGPPLDDRRRDAALRMVGFHRKWLRSPSLRLPQVRRQLDRCLDQPELVRLDPRWGKVILFDHQRCELHYFYEDPESIDLSPPWMVASHRRLATPFFTKFSAMAIHAGGLIRRGRAAVFLAPDEGGKSTVVNLCPERGGVLSDDHVLLRMERSRVRAHGSPFGRVADGEISADLGALFLLEKAGEFSLSPVEPGEVLAFLVDEHIQLFNSLPKAARIKAFEVLAAACYQAGTYRLRFPKSFIDWRAVDEAVAGASAGQPPARPGAKPKIESLRSTAADAAITP